jgi:acyl-CoA-dependent ceramide synthase
MTEPFPPLGGTLHKNHHSNDNIRQRRRQSSGLGGDIRGDVDVPSFATARRSTPPLHSPANTDMSVCKQPRATRRIPAHLRTTMC